MTIFKFGEVNLQVNSQSETLINYYKRLIRVLVIIYRLRSRIFTRNYGIYIFLRKLQSLYGESLGTISLL
ncbi:hypothetical protein Goarm_022879 [Gossypium armourianum]|uniref:Uncharacterized protein n=1 Tax=Gossypium armourianum TaxID=34283 RepID=A0A7J9KIP7_9ROSI|nr:hypothetical protein [Gossypium armourianum]